jgi:hypothetical protein
MVAHCLLLLSCFGRALIVSPAIVALGGVAMVNFYSSFVVVQFQRSAHLMSE